MRALGVLLLLVGCDALPDLPEIKPEFQEPAAPFESCEDFCGAPEREYDDSQRMQCEGECGVAELECPDALQDVYDCWYAWRTNATAEGEEDPVEADDCRGLQFDMGNSCGVDLIADQGTARR